MCSRKYGSGPSNPPQAHDCWVLPWELLQIHFQRPSLPPRLPRSPLVKKYAPCSPRHPLSFSVLGTFLSPLSVFPPLSPFSLPQPQLETMMPLAPEKSCLAGQRSNPVLWLRSHNLPCQPKNIMNIISTARLTSPSYIMVHCCLFNQAPSFFLSFLS